MPEGDTIHRAARRIDVALRGCEIVLADAPNARSPIHGRVTRLEGSVLERVEARGKHLLAHFSTGEVIHSHLGMNGRWWITADGQMPYGKPWLVLSSGRGIASQTGGKLLRLVSESRIRNDPGLAQLGPDPLGGSFDTAEAASRLRQLELAERSATLSWTRQSSPGSGMRSETRPSFGAGSLRGTWSRTSTPSSLSGSFARTRR